MNYRFATAADASLLGELNHQLIHDEGHRNPMSVVELADRMRGWLAGEYRAILFSDGVVVVAYALFKESESEVYCRQLFVARNGAARGSAAPQSNCSRSEVWPKNKRLLVEVLSENAAAVAFWRAAGFRDYSLALEIPPHVGGSP